MSLRHGDTAGLVAAVRGLHNDPEAHRRARTAFEQAFCDSATLPAFDALLDER